LRAEDIGLYPNGAPEAGEAERPTRRGRPRRDPGGVWALRESVWNATQRDARRQAILAQLREALPEREEGLHGWPEICAFLTRLGLRNRVGGVVTPRVGRGWRRRLNMPLLLGRPGQNGRYGVSLPFATTYTLVAWALSLYRSGGPEMPRIVALRGAQNRGRAVGTELAAPHVGRGSAAAAGGSARATPPDEHGAIAAPSRAASSDCEAPKPAAEATATANAAERICTWCGRKWLSPTPFRPTRCPLCACLTDRSA